MDTLLAQTTCVWISITSAEFDGAIFSAKAKPVWLRKPAKKRSYEETVMLTRMVAKLPLFRDIPPVLIRELTQELEAKSHDPGLTVLLQGTLWKLNQTAPDTSQSYWRKRLFTLHNGQVVYQSDKKSGVISRNVSEIGTLTTGRSLFALLPISHEAARHE